MSLDGNVRRGYILLQKNKEKTSSYWSAWDTHWQHFQLLLERLELLTFRPYFLYYRLNDSKLNVSFLAITLFLVFQYFSSARLSLSCGGIEVLFNSWENRRFRKRIQVSTHLLKLPNQLRNIIHSFSWNRIELLLL